MCAKVVHALLARGVPGDRIGVIAFFRAQVSQIRERIAKGPAAARRGAEAEGGEDCEDTVPLDDTVMVRPC